MSDHPHRPASDSHLGAGHDAGHGEHHSHKGTYITILLVLAFLTLVEVFIPEVYSAPWNQTTKMLLLVILAVAKAMLVAMFFMHLKWESTWIKNIALMPVYMGVFTILLMLETWYRQVNPGS